MNFAIAKMPNVQEKDHLAKREKFVLPKSNVDKDLFYEYTRTIKRDSPVEYKVVAGICFQKRTFSPDFSFLDNQKTIPDQYIPTILLTETQAEAVQKRLEEVPLVIPRILNKDGRTHTEGYTCKMSDHLVLKKIADYSIPRVIPGAVGNTSIREELIKEQKKKP